jgi:hypothetical protein
MEQTDGDVLRSNDVRTKNRLSGVTAPPDVLEYLRKVALYDTIMVVDTTFRFQFSKNAKLLQHWKNASSSSSSSSSSSFHVMALLIPFYSSIARVIVLVLAKRFQTKDPK